ncbi:TetR/AcrR family transcriptional regulator [Corynebacterium falsenii]|uniref:TetR/AcrR family transcriptional regulator n=1 Tax=Corynebacterium falsenii TaxID=108486 RepID=UPI001DB337F9|nr:TetR/AcrR family transcriptional regulator [Corynebacterium falsenii]HJF12095.1 TetR/AcrR family transcriptional regulator [Corynebacterium falsenii]
MAQDRTQGGAQESPRAAARRQAILAAARRVFVHDGYHSARLTDIAAQAGCSVGTVYTYFEDRSELLSAVLEQVEQEMRGRNRTLRTDGDTVEEVKGSISQANRFYLESFRKNAKEMALMEQVALSDPVFHRQRQERAARFVKRNAGMIRTLQDKGIVRAGEDPEMLSAALSVMVSRLAYNAFVEGNFLSEYTVEQLAETVDEVWFRTLGLEKVE